MDINQPIQNEQKKEPADTMGSVCCSKDSKKNSIVGIIIIVVLAGAVAVLALLKSDFNLPQLPVQLPRIHQPIQTSSLSADEDSTAAISQQLNDVVVTDLDSEFKDIDAGLNQL